MTAHPTLGLVDAIAARLADPDTVPLGSKTLSSDRQHLAYGPPGIALLHIELAANGLGPWHRAHDWLVLHQATFALSWCIARLAAPGGTGRPQ